MKNIFYLLLSTLVLIACNETENILSPNDFEAAIKAEGTQIVDARTPGEFRSEHIENAVNYDINGAEFETQINKLDKTKPVYVYCLSGGRSSSAASIMKNAGFTQVFDLKGGMLAWTKARKPVVSDKPVASKVRGNAVEAKVAESIANDTLTMIDFWATWCGPCLKMKPSIDKLEKELHSEVEILSVDVDQQKNLSQKYQISAMPTLIFFKNNAEVYRAVGYKTESQLRTLINKYK